MSDGKLHELEFKSASRFVAYDRTTGEILVVHEVMEEAGCQRMEASDDDKEFSRQVAAANFGKDCKVMRLSDPKQWKPGRLYRINPASEELVDVGDEPMTYRTFVAASAVSTTEEYP